MADYNSDFRDLVDKITPNIVTKFQKAGWSSMVSGYYNQQNDVHVIGFRRKDINDFPIILALTFHFPWDFKSMRTFSSFPSNEYVSSSAGGGRLVFRNEFNFELLVDPFLFRNFRNDGFKVEDLEFENIQSEKFSIDKTKMKTTFKEFNTKDFSNLSKWLDQSLPIMEKRLEEAITLQVERRFNEVLAFNEELALKYAPESAKHLFLF